MDFAGEGVVATPSHTDRGQVRLRKPPSSLLDLRAGSVCPSRPPFSGGVDA